MSNKILATSILTLVLLAMVVVPVLAVPPEKWTWEVEWGPDFLVDCNEYGYDFDILWIRNIYFDGKDFYYKDGTFRSGLIHLTGEDTFFNSSDPEKMVSGNFSFIEKWYMEDGWDIFIHHGLEIHITVPGYGVVFLQSGTIEYNVTWDEEGNEIVVIPHSAGPKMWLNEEYGMLCAALAE